ncbi:hypothetical protein K378_05634 [Streptomyces sp. Amel2xB2]|uniref:hypothetical protein n=1 Tax=Streptomyces sp. Amel2xB2 TaxID=1305829 RepID=UPI000DBA01D6|nr:hypothetical protein [Streptomyces sp. Amel2xB2]RAJ56633.1 hypothetical protein K378_05634 [Streptomyces sp. Amel2xB2]
MTDPTPGGERRRVFSQFVKRDLPERAKASRWCGKHDKARTQLVGRRVWVCLECVREQSRSHGG